MTTPLYNDSIGIPYAIRNAGLLAGILLLLLVSWMTDKSLRILIELANFHPKLKNLGVHTFEDLMSIPFGRAGTLFVLVNMYVLSVERLLFFVWLVWLKSFSTQVLADVVTFVLSDEIALVFCSLGYVNMKMLSQSTFLHDNRNNGSP